MVGAGGWRKAATVAAFLAPSLVCLLAFSLGPMVGTLWTSLQEWNLLRPARFIGLDNYRELWGDEDFRRALRNTLYYLVGYLPLVTIGGLGLALLVNRGLRASPSSARCTSSRSSPAGSWWRCCGSGCSTPTTASSTASSPRSASRGPAGGRRRPGRCRRSILASAWKDLGFVMVILLAGLQSIPESLYEAATIDGATRGSGCAASPSRCSRRRCSSSW